MAYRVMLIENDRLLLEQLAQAVQSAEGFQLVARYQSASDALGQGKLFKPNIILLNIDNQDGATLIEKFIQVYPEAAIICMSEHSQAEGVSSMVQAGAKGFIIKPFNAEELKESVETFAKSGMEVSSHVMTFFSPKGKSGKTTLIANLALALGRRTQEQVGIIDADLQFGDMMAFFNLKPKATIVEAVHEIRYMSPVTLNSYFEKVTDHVHVLCGTSAPNLIDRVSIDGFENVVRMARNLFRYILIDVPPGFTPTSISAAELSDVTYVVTMLNGGYELQHTKRALEIFKDWQDYDKRVKPVFTRVTPCDIASQRRLEQALGEPVEAVIPNAYQIVSEAANNGSMAVDIEPDSELSQSVNRLAEKVIGHHHIRWDKP